MPRGQRVATSWLQRANRVVQTVEAGFFRGPGRNYVPGGGFVHIWLYDKQVTAEGVEYAAEQIHKVDGVWESKPGGFTSFLDDDDFARPLHNLGEENNPTASPAGVTVFKDDESKRQVLAMFVMGGESGVRRYFDLAPPASFYPFILDLSAPYYENDPEFPRHKYGGWEVIPLGAEPGGEPPPWDEFGIVEDGRHATLKDGWVINGAEVAGDPESRVGAGEDLGSTIAELTMVPARRFILGTLFETIASDGTLVRYFTIGNAVDVSCGEPPPSPAAPGTPGSPAAPAGGAPRSSPPSSAVSVLSVRDSVGGMTIDDNAAVIAFDELGQNTGAIKNAWFITDDNDEGFGEIEIRRPGRYIITINAGISIPNGSGRVGLQVSEQGHDWEDIDDDVADAPVESVSLDVTEDSYFDSADPTTNNGTATDLIVGWSLSGAHKYRAVLRVDLAGIPYGAIVTDASLWGDVTDTPFATKAHTIYEVYPELSPLLDWTEAGVSHDDYAAGEAWTTGGGDVSADGKVGYNSPTAMGYQKIVAGMAELVRRGLRSRRREGNWLTRADAESGIGDQSFTIDSSEGTTPPKLVVDCFVPNVRTSAVHVLHASVGDKVRAIVKRTAGSLDGQTIAGSTLSLEGPY